MPLNADTSVHRYCLAKGFVAKRGQTNDDSITHTLLDGGRYCVSDAGMDGFLRAYTQSMFLGERIYVVERRTPLFKMLADFDFLRVGGSDPLSVDDIIPYLRTVQTTLGELLPGESRRLIVCTAEPKNVTKGGIALVKTGFHAIWPEIWVNEELAMTLRRALLYRLTETHGEFDGPGGWAEVLDKAVYTSNGLRMVGSRKARAVRAPDGQGLQFADEGRVYQISHVLDGDCALLCNGWPTDPYRTTCETSIRWNPDRLPCIATLIDPVPTWIPAPESLKRKVGGGAVGKPCDTSDRRHQLVNDFMRHNFPGDHQLRVLVPGADKLSYIAKSTSKYCINKGGVHNGCDIYFTINSVGMRQRCYCKCESKRTYGPCSKFASAIHLITPEMQRALFPTVKRKAAAVSPIPDFTATRRLFNIVLK